MYFLWVGDAQFEFNYELLVQAFFSGVSITVDIAAAPYGATGTGAYVDFLSVGTKQ